MKIFFIGSKKESELYQQSLDVLKAIEKFDHTVDKSQMQTSYEQEIAHMEEAYKNNYNAIKKCDVVVVEASGFSSGIGFLVATALNEKKPVLALHNKNTNASTSVTLKSVKNKHFKFAEYTENDLEQILKSFFQETKSILDTKFILIISPEIDHYLQWVSDNRRMHKAQVVRLALEEGMEKDKEYKDFIRKNR
jgi:nucleoside 2-deoxyribosyltransferase